MMCRIEMSSLLLLERPRGIPLLHKRCALRRSAHRFDCTYVLSLKYHIYSAQAYARECETGSAFRQADISTL